MPIQERLVTNEEIYEAVRTSHHEKSIGSMD